MRISELKEEALNDHMIEKLIFDIPIDDGRRGDVIFVFGSVNFLEERVDKAVQLYQAKRAPKILFSGGFTGSGTIKEAVLMRQRAIELGVPAKDILMETEAMNTSENVIASMLTLHRLHPPFPRHIIVVSSLAHMKRCILTLKNYMPPYITYSFAYNETLCNRYNWTQDERRKELVKAEAKKLISYSRVGHIYNEEIY